jgi:hypothetical protein
VQQSTIAIVVTVLDPGPSFKTWIDYHLQVVDHLYIFLDKPGNGDEQLIPDVPGVHMIAGAQNALTGPNGVMERQVVNAMSALSTCRNERIDWLLHIDADEMLWSPDMSFKAYLAGLDPGVSTVSFVNHEVLVRDQEVRDCFKELHLFKRNSYQFAEGHWMRKRKYQFFSAYTNGKSAVRVEKQNGRGGGVHQFEVTDGARHFEKNVCVLHYPCPSYPDWLKKYARLGDFPAYFVVNGKKYPMTGFEYFLDSRDAYLKSLESGNWEIATRFYKDSLLTDHEVSQLREEGAVFHVDPLQRFSIK